jgi:hypothetical protein
VLQTRPRVRAIPAWRRRLAPAAAAVAGTLGLTAWTVSSPTPYPLVSRALGLKPLTLVHTNRPVVGLVVEAPSRSIAPLAANLFRRQGRASFAVSEVPRQADVRGLRRLGDDLLPVCRSAAFASWLALRHRLSTEARGLGLHNRFYYLAPDSFTLADYVAARTAGGHPVRGAVGFAPGKRLDVSDLEAGIVIVVQWSPRSSLQAFDGLLAALAARDLRPVPLGELLASARRTEVTGLERATSATPRSTAARATTRPARVAASLDQRSWATTGASSTGASVVTPNTIGAT